MIPGHSQIPHGLLRGYPPVAAWWFGRGVFLAAICDEFSLDLVGGGPGRSFSAVYFRTVSQNLYRIRRINESELECTNAREGVPFPMLAGLTGSGPRGEVSPNLIVGEQACLGGRMVTSTVVEIVALTEECIYRGVSMGSVRFIADLYTDGFLTLLPTEFQDRVSQLSRD